MCIAPIYSARNNFSSLVKVAENGEIVALSRHNKPVAVIISYEDFIKMSGNHKTTECWLTKWRQENTAMLDAEGIPYSRSKECPKRNIWEEQ